MTALHMLRTLPNNYQAMKKKVPAMKKKRKKFWPKRDSNPGMHFGTAWETLSLTIWLSGQ